MRRFMCIPLAFIFTLLIVVAGCSTDSLVGPDLAEPIAADSAVVAEKDSSLSAPKDSSVVMAKDSTVAAF